MKKFIGSSIILFGVCAVALATASSSFASQPPEPQGSAKSAAKKASIFDAKPSPGYRDRVVYVISDYVPTGSNVPVVYRVYHGAVTSTSMLNRSTYYDLISTGSESVGGALARIDPAVTNNGGHR